MRGLTRLGWSGSSASAAAAARSRRRGRHGAAVPTPQGEAGSESSRLLDPGLAGTAGTVQSFPGRNAEPIPASRSVVTAPSSTRPITEAREPSSASGRLHSAPLAWGGRGSRGSSRPITEADSRSSASGKHQHRPQGSCRRPASPCPPLSSDGLVCSRTALWRETRGGLVPLLPAACLRLQRPKYSECSCGTSLG